MSKPSPSSLETGRARRSGGRVSNRKHSHLGVKSLEAAPWVVLASAATVVEGLPGHTIPFFSGDLAYHLGTAQSILTSGNLSGVVLYPGIPSFYGGIFPLVFALLGRVGIDPGSAEMVLSWFEPVLWVTAAWMLSTVLWRDSRIPRVVFATFVMFGAGVALPPKWQWAAAPNLAGQVFWPMFPRDFAMMLLMVAIAASLRCQWWLAGLLTGLTITTQPQVGALCGLLMVVTAFLVHEDRHRLRWAVGSAVVAMLVSSWWWIPRIVWTARYGLSVTNYELRLDVPANLETLWRAYALLLPLALVGLALLFRRRPFSDRDKVVALWVLVSLLMLLVAAVYAGALLALRRALVLSALPVAILSADALWWVAGRLVARATAAPWVRVLVSLAMVLCVVAVSIPVLTKEHARVEGKWARSVYGMITYPNGRWDPIWARIREDDSPVLATPGDAALTWFRTGRPVLWAPRPGFLKLGFDVKEATGWSEPSRADVVRSAFLGGPRTLCRVARGRHAKALLLRSAPSGDLGVTDFSGGSAVDEHLTGRGSTKLNRNDVVVAVVPPLGVVDLSATDHDDRIEIWELKRASPRFRLQSGSNPLTPIGSRVDGESRRTTYATPTHDSGRLRLVNRARTASWLVRVVGYRGGYSTSDGPATLIRTRSFCAKAGH